MGLARSRLPAQERVPVEAVLQRNRGDLAEGQGLTSRAARPPWLPAPRKASSTLRSAGRIDAAANVSDCVVERTRAPSSTRPRTFPVPRRWRMRIRVSPDEMEPPAM
jgi:hypothetical protein